MSDELAVYRQCVDDFRALVARFPQLMVPANRARFSSYMRKQMIAHVNSIRKQMYTQGNFMPPKDYRTMGEDLVNIAVRIPASVMGEIDAHVERLRVASRWAKVGRSDALRDLILRALDSLTTPVSVSPQPMPPAVSPQPEPTIAPGAGGNSEQIETIIATPENNYYEQIETVLPSDMSEASIRAQQEPTSDTTSIDTMPPVQPNVLQAAQNPALANVERATFDTTKYRLGKLCPQGHEYQGTGQSLRVNNKAGYCKACNVETKQRERDEKKKR